MSVFGAGQSWVTFHESEISLPTSTNETSRSFQIAVPNDGFGSKLDTINAWHLYGKNKQRRGGLNRSARRNFGADALKISKLPINSDSDLAAKCYPDPPGELIVESLDHTRLVEKVSCNTDESKA